MTCEYKVIDLNTPDQPIRYTCDEVRTKFYSMLNQWQDRNMSTSVLYPDAAFEIYRKELIDFLSNCKCDTPLRNLSNKKLKIFEIEWL